MHTLRTGHAYVTHVRTKKSQFGQVNSFSTWSGKLSAFRFFFSQRVYAATHHKPSSEVFAQQHLVLDLQW